MSEQEDIRIIEKYLDGTLPPDAKSAVDQRREKDREFAALFEQHTFILDGFAGLELEAIEEQLKKGRPFKTEKSTANGRRTLAFFLFIVAILVAAIFLFRKNSEANVPQFHAELAEQYYQPPMAETIRSVRDRTEQEYFEAMESYAAGNWSEAMPLFTELAATEQYSYPAKYYLAHCYYQSGDYLGAGERFASVAGAPGEFKSAAQWYQALSWLHLPDETNKATTLLKEIQSRDGFFRERAALLLDALRR